MVTSDIAWIISHNEVLFFTYFTGNSSVFQRPQTVSKNQTLDIDALTGASFSSKGLLNAVSDVIKQAGGNPDDFKSEKIPVTGASEHIDETENEETNNYGQWRTAPDHWEGSL
ncbi:FMN-binding protein [Limosilactobacillus fermentum]